MDRTAGFAASISIRQELINRLIRVLYNANLVKHTMVVSAPELAVNLFLSAPTFTIDGSQPENVQLDLYGWGPVTVTPPAGTPESRRVKFRARISVPQTISISAGRLLFGFDSPNATVSNVQIDPYAGGAFSTATLAYLVSPDFHALLTTGLQMQLAGLGQVIPPLDLSFLGALAVDPTATVFHKSVDEAIVLGLDVSSSIVTHGSGSALTDVSAGNDIGMWTNPRAVPIAYSDIKTKISDQVVDAGATLNSFDLEVQEGHFHIAGNASETGGSVNFSLDAVPELVRPGVHVEYDEEYGEHVDYWTPTRDELWFDTQNVDVDIDQDWWVVLLEGVGSLLTLGIGALVVGAILDMIRGNITSGINQSEGSGSSRNQNFTLPGVTRPPMTLRIETFECHAEGVFVGLTIKPTFWGGEVDGPWNISAEESLIEVVQYQAKLPPDAFADDPELRIAWTVRRTDTNAILVSQDVQAQSSLVLRFDHTSVPFLEISKLSIETRIYRTLGAGSDDLFYQIRELSVTDYVDRTHPYIRWQHESFVPLVQVESDGTHTILGNEIVLRRSAIHRTALPGRCRMLRHYSTQKFGDPRGYPVLYTDDLPFPLEDLIVNRAQVCDYCFFGGPTRTVPLIPIVPTT